MPVSVETIERELADAFFAELRALHARLAWPDYAVSTIRLTVEYSAEKAKYEISVDAGPSYSGRQSVRGSSLGPLMDELYRRFDYQDKADAQIEASFKALPAPTDQ